MYIFKFSWSNENFLDPPPPSTPNDLTHPVMFSERSNSVFPGIAASHNPQGLTSQSKFHQKLDLMMEFLQ